MKLNLKQMDIVFIVVLVLFCILLCIYYYSRKIESFQCIQFDVVGQGSLDKSIEMDYGKVHLSSTNNYVKFNKTFQTVPVVFTQVIGEGEQVSMVNLSQITKEGFAYHVHSIYNQKIPLDKEDMDEENPKENTPIERIIFEKDKVNGFYWMAFVKNDTKIPILAEEEALPKQKGPGTSASPSPSPSAPKSTPIMNDTQNNTQWNDSMPSLWNSQPASAVETPPPTGDSNLEEPNIDI